MLNNLDTLFAPAKKLAELNKSQFEKSNGRTTSSR
jgi:hypothetical protein